MPPVYEISLLTTRLTDVVAAIDGGGSNGTCDLYSVTDVLLATVNLSFPCGTVSGNVLTFSGMPWTGASVIGGDPNYAIIRDSIGNPIIAGLTVGTGSTSFDIVTSGTTIYPTQTVTINSATITGR